MKKNVNTDKAKDLNDIPDKVTVLISEAYDSHDTEKKLAARTALVKMGKAVLPRMYKIIASENEQQRIEAAKVVELVADKSSVPMFIDLLDDEEFEIRWIAAEGLIKIGRLSIMPLLKSVRDGKSSLVHNRGVHHVLINLLSKTEKNKLRTLLLSLDDAKVLGETAPVEAYKAIERYLRENQD